MGGAVAAIAIGSILTWGVGLVVAIVTAGITALVHSQTVPTHLRSGEFVTAGVCFGLLAVGIAIGPAAVRSGAAKRKAIEEQIAEESRFNQRATITVTYLRADGTTAQVVTTEVVPRLEVPQRGDPATIWYDPSTGEAIANLGG